MNTALVRNLRGFRAEGANFVGESFSSIIGYKGNGAIIHYSAKAEGSKEVTNDSSILVDSGGQYLEGTTDITRSLALGAVTDEFKKDSTLVLQGDDQAFYGRSSRKEPEVYSWMLLQGYRYGWQVKITITEPDMVSEVL